MAGAGLKEVQRVLSIAESLLYRNVFVDAVALSRMKHAAQSPRHSVKLYIQTYLNTELCKNLLNYKAQNPRQSNKLTGLLFL